MISVELPHHVFVDVQEDEAYSWLLSHQPAGLIAGHVGRAPQALLRRLWDQNPHLRQWAAVQSAQAQLGPWSERARARLSALIRRVHAGA